MTGAKCRTKRHAEGCATEDSGGVPGSLRIVQPRHRVERLVSEPFHLAPGGIGRSERRERVASALLDVGLSPSDMHRYIHQFSGGQRQRIALARALVLRPDIIVLDEAVSALDVSIRAQILDLLSDLQRKHGLAYLFISHDLTVVNAVTDRVLVMWNGKVVEEGATKDVFRAPKHDYTKATARGGTRHTGRLAELSSPPIGPAA